MSKFEDDIRRISVLINDLGDGRDGDAWDRLRSVLEAAAKVDKALCLYILDNIDDCDATTEEWEQITSVFAALPDKEER